VRTVVSAADLRLVFHCCAQDEDNPFGITQEDVSSFIDLDTELMACNYWGGIVAMGPNQARGLLMLCISDRNKTMLIECPGLVPHMIASLMLDPEHKRHGTSDKTKERVQRDYAECIQQISLFPPGRAALQSWSAELVEALDTLVERAWSEEAKDCARGALMQLCPDRIKRPQSRLVEQTGDGNGTQAGGGHVMISYQWVRACPASHSSPVARCSALTAA
jgi:hypothetical protein